MFEVDMVISRLSFSKETLYIKTDRGLLSIQPHSTSVLPVQAQAQNKIFVKSHWVARGTEDCLWLPSDYRTKCSAFQNDTLVLGHSSGHVRFIKFTLS